MHTNYTTKGHLSSNYLIHYRTMSMWSRSVGMSYSQSEIYWYIAGMLATNKQCWISMSGLAKSLRVDRRNLQKTVKGSSKFFDHDVYSSTSPTDKRFWHLVIPVPTEADLDKFLPWAKIEKNLRKNDAGNEEDLRKNAHPPCVENTQVPASNIRTDPAYKCPQSIKYPQDFGNLEDSTDSMVQDSSFKEPIQKDDQKIDKDNPSVEVLTVSPEVLIENQTKQHQEQPSKAEAVLDSHQKTKPVVEPSKRLIDNMLQSLKSYPDNSLKTFYTMLGYALIDKCKTYMKAPIRDTSDYVTDLQYVDGIARYIAEELGISFEDFLTQHIDEFVSIQSQGISSARALRQQLSSVELKRYVTVQVELSKKVA